MMKILCVEDSPETLNILRATFNGHEIHTASTLGTAREQLLSEKFSVLLLDIELPDGNGMDLCADLPDLNKDLPVIFLTGKQDFPTKVSAFALGAEDFVQKPFDPKELRLRTEAKARKNQQMLKAAKIIQVGEIICNLDEQRIYSSRSPNKAINLTGLEFRILVLLARTPNKIFTRQEIVERVWGGDSDVTERAVDVHVSNLRKKLQLTDVNIEGVIGTGYRVLVRA